MIAHRLSTVRKAHRIVVLEKGKIKEVGSHQQLLDQKGAYHKLYELQAIA
jgi:ABC-type multidrug transport system fused ATPase/permease subunit